MRAGDVGMGSWLNESRNFTFFIIFFVSTLTRNKEGQTIQKTNAGEWNPGKIVNIETDIIARYVEKMFRR